MTAIDLGIGRYWKRAAPWLLLAALLVPPLFCELVLAIAPSRLIYAPYCAVAAFVLLKSFPLPWKRQLVGVFVLSAALLVLHLVPWNSRKVFLAEFDRIETAMSVEQVHSLMAPVSIGPERQADLSERGYRHSDAPRFDSDIGVVRFSEGRVTAKQFLPD